GLPTSAATAQKQSPRDRHQHIDRARRIDRPETVCQAGHCLKGSPRGGAPEPTLRTLPDASTLAKVRTRPAPPRAKREGHMNPTNGATARLALVRSPIQQGDGIRPREPEA